MWRGLSDGTWFLDPATDNISFRRRDLLRSDVLPVVLRIPGGLFNMTSFNSVLFIGSCCVLFMGLSALDFEDCGSVHGEFSTLKLTDCDPSTMDQCPLKRGKNVTINVTFTTKEVVTEVDVNVYGHIVVPIPFILPNPNGCVDSGLTCPLANNTEYTYTLTLPIKMMYPKLKVDIKLQLEDQNGEDVICVMIPARIV